MMSQYKSDTESYLIVLIRRDNNIDADLHMCLSCISSFHFHPDWILPLVLDCERKAAI